MPMAHHTWWPNVCCCWASCLDHSTRLHQRLFCLASCTFTQYLKTYLFSLVISADVTQTHLNYMTVHSFLAVVAYGTNDAIRLSFLHYIAWHLNWYSCVLVFTVRAVATDCIVFVGVFFLCDHGNSWTAVLILSLMKFCTHMYFDNL